MFVIPKAKTLDASAKVPGTDGDKMSKSYDNFIEIFEPVKSMKKKVMRISTDSREMHESKPPETDHLFQLFSLFGSQAEIDSMADLYRAGGFGYGDIKKKIAEAAADFFEPARERRLELEAKPEKLKEILGDGAAQARKKASEVLLRAQKACGLK